MTKEELLALEKELTFEKFKPEYGLLIGEELLKWMKDNYKFKTGFRIRFNGLTLFQVLMPLKNEEYWLNWKEKMVLDSGHCSYYSYLNGDSPKGEVEEGYVIIPGGFPILVNGEVKGTICFSGLKAEDDHQVIVDALMKLKKQGSFR